MSKLLESNRVRLRDEVARRLARRGSDAVIYLLIYLLLAMADQLILADWLSRLESEAV